MISLSPRNPTTGIVSVDWWAMQCKHLSQSPFVEPALPDGLCWVALKSTNVWNTRGYILNDIGNKVATVLANPISKIIPQENVQIEIANRYLYSEDFRQVCTHILQYCNVVSYGLNRVDLCCDFEMRYHMWKALQLLDRGDAYLKNIKLDNGWHEHVKGRRVCYDFNWGSLDSVFRWKLYYKWWELQNADATNKKPYILGVWRDAGFDETNVWRVEVSIKKTNGVRDFANNKLPLWDWYEKRTTIFQSLYADKFVIRLNEHHKDKRNDTVVPFLDVAGFKMLKRALPTLRNTDSDPEKRLTCKLWRELNEVDTQANQFASTIIRDALRELVQNDGNVWILNRMYNVTIEDIEHALY